MIKTRFVRTIFSLFLFFCISLTIRAQFEEHIVVFTDKDCYVSGERMHVSISVTGKGQQTLGLSKVAYVELSDTHGLQVQTMVQLTDGRGWAQLFLPATLHSGCYQLTAYTRNLLPLGERAFSRSLVGVVNTEQLQTTDRVTFHQPRTLAIGMRRRYEAGQTAHITLPRDSAFTVCAVSVVRHPLPIDLFEAPEPSDKVYAQDADCLPELEGHIVQARVEGDMPASMSLLAGVGKGNAVVEGFSTDGGHRWQYVTNNMAGNLPMVVNGYDSNKQPVGMEIMSPYAQVLPRVLPVLDVYAGETTLRQRAESAKRETQLLQVLGNDTIQYSPLLFSRQPDRLYVLDEWVRFSTVRKTLLEYIMNVRRRTLDGHVYLFVIMEDGGAYENLPALVTLDGVPVYDIDSFLDYDARLLQYIQIYTGVYTFGGTLYHGVVSFITNKGLLSNYQLDKGTKLVRYDFPQQRPPFTLPQGDGLSTVYWNPQVDASEVDFPVPTTPGVYQVILQGVDARGKTFRSASEIEVK